MSEITGTFNGKRIRVFGNNITVSNNIIFVDGKEINPDDYLIPSKSKTFWDWLKGLFQ